MPDTQSRKSVANKPAMRLSKVFTWLMLFVFVIFCVVALGIGYWFRTYCPPIKLEKSNSEVLTGWLLLRDFRPLDSVTQEGLLKEYISHFGPDAPASEPNRIYGLAVKIAGKYAGERTRRVNQWGISRGFPNLLRAQYRIVPRRSHEGESEYICSNDIVPTEELLGLLDSGNYPTVPAAMTKTEGNCRILTKRWFQLRMKEYCAKPDEEKIPFLISLTEELDWWQCYYNDFLVAMGLPPDSRLELMRELSMLVASWYVDESGTDLAKLLWFKDLVISFSVMKQLGVTDYDRFVPIKHGPPSRLIQGIQRFRSLREGSKKNAAEREIVQ